MPINSSRWHGIAGLWLTAVAALMASGLGLAESVPAPQGPAEVAMPNSRRVEVTSAINGVTYVLRIAIPQTAPPVSGYPVIFVLDGDSLSGIAVDAARAIIGGERSPVVVTIGYGAPSSYSGHS